MQVCSKDKASNQGDLQMLLDQNKRLTSEKLQMMSRYQKEILSKNILLKQTQQKVIKLEKQLDLAENKIQTYKYQIVPQIFERTQELQLNMNNLKNRILDLVKDVDVQQSLDQRQLVQNLKKLDTGKKYNSPFDNFQQNTQDLSIPVSFIPIDMNCMNMLFNSLEQTLKAITDQNKYLQQRNSKYEQQLKQSKSTVKQIIFDLENELKYTKQLILTKQKDFSTLRHQHCLLQKILNQTQQQKIRLFEQISSNINTASKKQNNELQTFSTSKLIKLIGTLSTNIQQIQKTKRNLQQQLYLSKSSHVFQLQQMSNAIFKVKEQTQNELKHKQNEIIALRNKCKK